MTREEQNLLGGRCPPATGAHDLLSDATNVPSSTIILNKRFVLHREADSHIIATWVSMCAASEMLFPNNSDNKVPGM